MALDVQTTIVQAADGRKLCVEVAGDGHAGTVVVCGGTPNSRHLDPGAIEDAARRGLRLIGYDRPGYGQSEPQAGRTVADGAADVRAIASAHGLDRFAVLGFSMGGPYPLACAALLGDLVCAAAVVASKAPWGAPGLDYFAGMGEGNVAGIKHYFEDPEHDRRQTEALWRRVQGISAADLVAAWDTLLCPADRAVLHGAFLEAVAESIRDGLTPGSQGWWDDGVADLAPWGFELDAIRVPVKVWHGRQDRFVPPGHGEWLASNIPGAEAALTDSDGHWTLVARRIGEVHDWLGGFL